MIESAPGVIRLVGEGRGDAARVFEALATVSPAAGRLTLTVGDEVRIDAPTVAAVVAGLRLLGDRGVELQLEGAPALLARVAAQRAVPPTPPPESEGRMVLTVIGDATYEKFADMRAVLATVKVGAVDLVRLVLRRTSMPHESVTDQVAAMGTDGAGIVMLLSFLLGVILTLDATLQLRELGATSLVADVVGLSLFREFAPMLTAIVVIGRSGAAMASELASMTVDNEVNALRVMGIAPTSFLATPRLLGIMLVQPVLTLLASFVGVGGAVASSTWSGGLGPLAFYHRLIGSVAIGDVEYGMVKGLAFATATGLISCAVGLNTRGAAAEVGRATTRAVVLSIFFFVVIDSVFAVNSKAVVH